MTADPATTGLAALPTPARATPARAFTGLLRRDLIVLVKQWPSLIVGIVLRPLLLVFVFTCVLPKAGFAIGGPARQPPTRPSSSPGWSACPFTQGFTGVTVRFSIEFGCTKEIEDRVLAPLPIWAMGVQKLLAGALQAALAGLMVFPISALVPTTPVRLDIHWPILAAAAILAALLAAAFGLAAGTLIDPGKIQLAATALVLPVTFLGAVYYPWATLSARHQRAPPTDSQITPAPPDPTAVCSRRAVPGSEP
jgi:ABC-2 type transport system permease protein